MRIFYLIVAIIGVAVASYGFSGAIDEKAPKGTLRAFLFLVGVILMAMGLLLYGVPHFFSSSG